MRCHETVDADADECLDPGVLGVYRMGTGPVTAGADSDDEQKDSL